jgi:U3 small nucleolar RNA-associated protein 3
MFLKFQMCKQTNVIDEQLKDEIDFILNSLKTGKKIEILKNNLRNEKVKVFELKNDNESEMDNEDEGEEEEDEGEEESTKRPINYQIEKNKGLTPKRNKLYRNPRVRHREKYRKALIKRKSIVPKVRTEMKRYSGETTGIRTNVVKGTKLK